MGELDSAGSVLDPVKNALQDVIGLYSQVQAIKLNNQLAKAKISAEYAATPSVMQDAQAKAQSVYTAASNNKLLLGLAILAGAAAIYVIVK